MSGEVSYHKAVTDQSLSDVYVKLRFLNASPVVVEIVRCSVNVHA